MARRGIPMFIAKENLLEFIYISMDLYADQRKTVGFSYGATVK